MKMFRSDVLMWQKVFMVACLVGIVLGMVLVIYGEFSTSVGFVGVIDHGLSGAGFLLFGVGMTAILLVLATKAWKERPRYGGAHAFEGKQAHPALQAFVRETGVVALNLVCYVGSVIVALGALTGINHAPVLALTIMAVCIAVFVCYRVHRSRHRFTYHYFNTLSMLAFCATLAIAGLLGGGLIVRDAVLDATEGPHSTTCYLSDFEEHQPSGRYRGLQTTELVITFTTLDGNDVRVSIKEQDRAMLAEIAAIDGVAWLTFYPRTQVYVSAEPLLIELLATTE